MDQLQLDIDPDLTDWMLTSAAAPPRIGWWKTRAVSSPELLQPQRRFWDGVEWSSPVFVGVTDDENAEMRKNARTWRSLNEIEWCGLKQPHPMGYQHA